MALFLSALALAITLEGLLYAAFPDQMKKALASLLETPSPTIRMVALATAVFGIILLWLVRSLMG